MECDEDQGIGDKFNSPEAIMKEARAVYNQLKMLHFTLKGNHDGDSGKLINKMQTFFYFTTENDHEKSKFYCDLFTGLHSDLFLGSSDQISTHQFESTEELHQGMLAALTDDIINLVMSLDVVHFKTMLDKSRATSQEQEEELRKRQITIAELETKVSEKKLFIIKKIRCKAYWR